MRNINWALLLSEGDRLIQLSHQKKSIILTQEMAFGFLMRSMEKYLGTYVLFKDGIVSDKPINELLKEAWKIFKTSGDIQNMKLFMQVCNRIYWILQFPWQAKLDMMIMTTMKLRLFLKKEMTERNILNSCNDQKNIQSVS